MQYASHDPMSNTQKQNIAFYFLSGAQKVAHTLSPGGGHDLIL